MNFNFDLPDRFSVRFPPDIRQSVQSTKRSLIKRFRVYNGFMYRIVGVFQPDNAFGHSKLGMLDW